LEGDVTVRFLQGNVIKSLETLDEESVNLVVTSPPYWLQRSYVTDGHPLKEFEIGLEPTPELFVAALVPVFRAVRRVLRPDGVMFVNMGDCYITTPPGNKPNTTALSSGLPNSVANQEMRRAAQVKVNKLKATRTNRNDGLYDRKMDLQVGHGESREALWGPRKNAGLRNKELVGTPWMLAFALRADGWMLRQEDIWEKPNPMPESCDDRFVKAHEHLFMFVRNERYWWNKKAAQERMPGGEVRNRRTVMRVGIEQFPGAHFATFPQALIRPLIRIACPPGGVVLDPFGGAGTVGLVASLEHRNAVLCELWPPYVEMAKRRIQRHAGMFAAIDWSRKRERVRRPKPENSSKPLEKLGNGGRGSLSTSSATSLKAP
jgi:site-specific DNA-methyltransferase (adenine-specific)